ncbi:MAG: hypothetical protein QXY36_03670 [Sulfolobales archaeon]
MVIYKILTDELLSKELLPLSREGVAEVSRYVANMLAWCLNFNSLICNAFINSLESFIESLTKLRLMKYLAYGGGRGESIDASLMDELTNIITDYYKSMMYGLVDSNGNVVVKVVRDFEYGGVKYGKGSLTSIPLRDALLLSRVGYVKLMDELIIK